MSRETYPLTSESRTVLTDHVKDIALEMSVDASYLYQILSSAECDPFGKFRRLYSAAVRAGCDVSAWDASLSSIKARHCVQTNETSCLSKKITLDADTTKKLVEALEDGVIDETESRAIRRAIAKERDILDVIDAQLARNDRRENAAAVVRGKFK